MDLLSSSKPITLELPDASIIYYPNFFNAQQSDDYFTKLINTIKWRQDDITLFGKTYKQPRLTALYGINNKPYSYSNITLQPLSFTKELLDINIAIERMLQETFTTCLLNLYRDGNDSMGWHADNEKELGSDPTIASVSFGAERTFYLKHKTNARLKYKLKLKHGSLLLMKDRTQHFWLHQIPKTKKPIGKRINLTFRYIK